jgi:enoyl-CoA hydratase/carnithine racemase
MTGEETMYAGRVGVTLDGDVATISLDRPAKLNALTPEMLEQLRQAVESVRGSAARVVLVRSEGDRAFCVGADINRFAALAPVDMLEWTGRGHRVFDALAALPQPTIAVLHGPAFGGGFELALACDLRVMAASATLGLPEVGLGTIPGWGGTERLTELVGRARAKDVVLARRTIDAATAEQWGLVTTAVPLEDLEDAVAGLVERIRSAAPVAVTLAKTLIDAAADGAPSRVLETLAGAVTSATDDLAAGVDAFRHRQTPQFTGR